MALLAVYAASKNKFWELNDQLYGLAGHKKQVGIKELAQTVGMKPEELAGALYDSSIRWQLQRDIRQGNKLGISGTPGYVINGKVQDFDLKMSTCHIFNMMGRCPAISVPSGIGDNGVPTGLHIVSKAYYDIAVFRVASAFEKTWQEPFCPPTVA